MNAVWAYRNSLADAFPIVFILNFRDLLIHFERRLYAIHDAAATLAGQHGFIHANVIINLGTQPDVARGAKTVAHFSHRNPSPPSAHTLVSFKNVSAQC